MFIACKLQKSFLAPEERNKDDLASSSTKNHCAPLERESGIHHGIYKHSAPPEPACYLLAPESRCAASVFFVSPWWIKDRKHSSQSHKELGGRTEN
jgi:hypothetical protein